MPTRAGRLLCVLAAVATAAAGPPGGHAPSPPFTGLAIPDPPEQSAAWKPPASKVPDKFVADAKRLFEHGLAPQKTRRR